MKDGTSKSDKSKRKLGPYILVLRAVDSAAEAFPPLKSVAGAALKIVQTVDKYQADQEEWVQFAEHVAKMTTHVVERLSNSSCKLEDISTAAADLETTLSKIQAEIEKIVSKTTIKKIQRFVKDPGHIKELMQQLNDAVSLFQTTCGLSTAANLATLTSNLDRENSVTSATIDELADKLKLKLQPTASSLDFSYLPFALNSSWSPSSTCLPGTRTSTLQTITEWIESDMPTASIYVLSDVAGSGKSAIAHTVAKLCSERGTLLASFFFNAEALGRKNCSSLYTTMARDLCTFSPDLANAIRLTAHNEPNIASAASDIQYEKLIHHPLYAHAPSKRAVIVIDALDEGGDEHLLEVLRDRVPLLPPNIRILVTTRPDHNTLPPLTADKLPHITLQSFDLHGSSNQDDITLYFRSRLATIARIQKLTKWPQARHLTRLEEMSGGLFIWASTACDSLRHSPDAKAELKRLLSPSARPLPPMDDLYARILDKCDWTNERFKIGYQAYMGAVLTLKVPLSAQGLQSLLGVKHEKQSIGAKEILTPLQPVLSDFTGGGLVHTVHLSFTEFMSNDSYVFSLNLNASHEWLALRCLTLMNVAFSKGAAQYGGGYLEPPTPPIPDSHQTFEIPSPSKFPLPEELSYAVQWWTYHLSMVSNPLPSSVYQVLQKFLQTRLVHWVEISVIHGQFQPLASLRESRNHPFFAYILHADVAATLHRLSNALVTLGRREEALKTAEEALYIRRSITETDPSPKALHDLASTLNRLAARQLGLSISEPARLSAKESVTIFQSLSPTDHPFLSIDTANSLHTYAVTLHDIRQFEEALLAVSESIRLNKQILPRSISADDDLAMFLETLTFGLFANGREREAFEVDAELIALRRRLLTEDPSSPHQLQALANFLITYAGHLNANFARQEALERCEEALELIKRLSRIWPKNTDSLFVSCYSKITGTLWRLNREEECLAVAEKSVQRLRVLVQAEPAVYFCMLGDALVDVTEPLIWFKRYKEAVETAREALGIFRMLAESLPAHETSLVVALRTYSVALLEDGQYEEASMYAGEATALSKRLADESFSGGAESHGRMLMLYSDCLQKLGPSRLPELMASYNESLDFNTKVLEAEMIQDTCIPLLLQYASTLIRQGDTQAATTFAQQVLKYKATDPASDIFVEATRLLEECHVD